MPVTYYLTAKGMSLDEIILEVPKSYWINKKCPPVTLTWTRSQIADYECQVEMYTDLVIKRWVSCLRSDLCQTTNFLEEGGQLILTRSLAVGLVAM